MKIKINFREVRSANRTLPSVITKVSGIRRGIGLLKYRIPTEIQNKYELKERLDKSHRKLEEITNLLSQVYETTNVSLEQYIQTEAVNKSNADSFK